MAPRRDVLMLAALVASLTLYGVFYNLARVEQRTQQHRLNRMESHLKVWRNKRAVGVQEEAARFSEKLAARLDEQRKQRQERRQRQPGDGRPPPALPSDSGSQSQRHDGTESDKGMAKEAAGAAALHKLHQEELRMMQVEHLLEVERIDESIAQDITARVREAQVAAGQREVAARGEALRNARAKARLKWFCQLPQPEIQRLVEASDRNGTLTAFGAGSPGETMCLDGDQGVPRAPLPAARDDWRHMVFTKFESAVISRSIAALARWHIGEAMRDKLGRGNTAAKKTTGAGLVFPDSDVYRGSVVMLHPWLGVFYRVRVPIVVTNAHGKAAPEGAGDAFSYRQECFRRPWAYFSEDGFGVNSDETSHNAEDDDEDNDDSDSDKSARAATPRLRSVPDPPEGKELAKSSAMLHAILIMHPQVQARTVVALMHDVRKRMAKGSMLVALTIVPCVAKGCADAALLEQELQKKDGDEYMEICDPIVSSDVGSGGEEGTAAAADPWTTWRASLANVLSKSIHGDHVPVVLLDGHTSSLSGEFVRQVLAHTTARRRAVLPLSTYLSPTHRWKEIFFDKVQRKAQREATLSLSKNPNPIGHEHGSGGVNARSGGRGSSGDESASREKDNKAAYTERLVIPIAFSKVDGLAALEAWPFIEESLTSESSAMSGGGVAVCGRATLAWILQSSLGMELRRYFVRAPQLHTWDRKDAEASAGERAVGMLEEATKQHNEYLQRVKTSGGEIATGSDSKRGNLMHIPRMPAAAFFPDNMSPTTVTPELPARGASQFCDLALDALGLCDSCASDTRALTTVDVTQGTHGGAEMLHCSTLLGTDDASWTRVTDESGQGGTVFRSFNPLHGVVHDTEGPAHKYVQSLGQPDIFV